MLERANHAEHLGHVVSRAGLVLGALNPKGVSVLVQRIDHAIGQAADGFAVFKGTFDDLVVDIGHVAHISNLVATGLEPALHHVKGDHRAGMAQMAQVIDRHATDVHAHMAGIGR